MELKNVNPNGCNVEINNLLPMLLYFSKILKTELNKRLPKFILKKRFHNYL